MSRVLQGYSKVVFFLPSLSLAPHRRNKKLFSLVVMVVVVVVVEARGCLFVSSKKVLLHGGILKGGDMGNYSII